METGACVVLKGVPTIVADPEGRAFINPTGTPAMAKAGVGDVLTGMIAAFIAQGLTPLEASLLAVYTHGLAGEKAAQARGLHSVLASNLLDFIPLALISLHG
jgi:NAD(P)H-hydrate epimerase